MLGGQPGDDVPGLLAACHDQHGGQINELVRGPPVAATFSKLAQLTPASQDRDTYPLPDGPWKLPLEQRTVDTPPGFGHGPDEPPNAGLAPNSTARPSPPLITHGDEG
jgi:hypothetical protein